MSSFEAEDKKANNGILDDQGSMKSEGEPKLLGTEQQPIELDEEFKYSNATLKSRVVEADDSKGYFYDKKTGKNSFADNIGDLKLTAYGVDGDESVSSEKKYVANHARYSSKPKLGQLVKEEDSGQNITSVIGGRKDETVQTKHYPLPNNLFIDGGPKIEDAAQLNIGDCYFFGAVMHILNTQPSRIANMMKISGREVTTTFYRKDDKGKWVEQPITTQFGMHEQYDPDGKFDTVRKGCMYRLSQEVDHSEWSGDFFPGYAGMFQFTKIDYHKAAMWMYMMEQAYSFFASKYGKYGDGLNKNEDRYTAIKGGVMKDAFYMFFGDQTGASEVKNAEKGKKLSESVSNTSIIRMIIDMKKCKDEGSETRVFIGFYNSKENDLIGDGHQYILEDVKFAVKEGADIDIFSMNLDSSKNGKNKYKNKDYEKNVDDLTKYLDLNNTIVTIRNPHIDLDAASLIRSGEDKLAGQQQVSLQALIDNVEGFTATKVTL